YNFIYFGSIVPISGQAESIGSASLTRNVTFTLVSLADILSTFFRIPIYKVSDLVLWSWIAAVFAVAFFIMVKFEVISALKRKYSLRPLLPLLFFSITLSLCYVLFFHAPYFIDRYLQPVRILWLLLFSLGAPLLWQALKRAKPSHQKLGSFLAILVLGAGGIFSAFSYVRLYTETGVGDLYKAGLWAAEHHQEKIGMQQAGIASFVADNVVNLDGKVNSQVLDAMKKDERGKYIVSEKISYIIDWGEFATIPATEANSFGAHFIFLDSAERDPRLKTFKVYKNVN
ncbi:MAG: hypothetical protein ABI778_04280, partial [Ignavibacteriota bacterium]